MIDILNDSDKPKPEIERKLKVPIDFDTTDLSYDSENAFIIPEVIKKTKIVKQKTVGVNKTNKNNLF
jgi:hypothetical protein